MCQPGTSSEDIMGTSAAHDVRVIVVFPQFVNVEQIERVRRTYDPLEKGVPPHITLVFPFAGAQGLAELREHVGAVVAGMRPFPIELREITGHEGEYLFLNVKRGNDELIALHDQLYTGPLAEHRSWRHTYLPHLTVGRVADPAAFARAVRELRTVEEVFVAEVREVVIYCVGADGAREVEATLALGPA
jgi:2'-5' RNA ligase